RNNRARPSRRCPPAGDSNQSRYAGFVTFLDLRSIHLRPGEELRDEREVELQPLMLGGQRYAPVPAKVPAELVVTRATNGTMFELRLLVRLYGPCYRCLEDAVLERELALREYQAESPGGSDELTIPYLANGRLDLSSWARDALALALPEKILCREGCAGLCPVCGSDLNREPHEHETEEADPRWAALGELREKL